MKIENPLMTGNDLESLKFQSVVLQGMGENLATEGLNAGVKRVSEVLGAFVFGTRDFIIKKMNLLPTKKGELFKPNFPKLGRVERTNYGDIRSLVIPCIPETDAKVHDFLGYLDMMTDVVHNVLNQTIPGCKDYFSMVLEDVSVLGSASAASAIDRLSTNKVAIANVNKKYPGIIKRNDNVIQRASIAKQYDSMKDFAACQDYLGEICARAATFKIEQASKDVNDLNELISRVIMVIKRKDNIELDGSAVKNLSAYLYNLAEEIALISAFVTLLDTAMKVLTDQVDEILDQTGK